MLIFKRWMSGLVVAAIAAGVAGGAEKARKAQAPEPPLPKLEAAKWVWDAPGARTEGELSCYFRREVELPGKPQSATVLVTADNGYDLYVNGSVVGSDVGYDTPYWQSVEKYDIAHLLKAGRNALAIRGTNLGGPAGLIAAVRIDVQGRPPVEIQTDRTWRLVLSSETGWTHEDFDASAWKPAAELGKWGMKPWGAVAFGSAASPGQSGRRQVRGFAEPGEGYPWPAAVVFLTGRVGESSTRLPQSVWRIAGSRAYHEMDKLGPSLLGRQMHVLRPARPDGVPRLLVDAGAGVIGSPSVSWDGRTIYFAMAREGEKFLHVWRVPAEGGQGEQLTRGPFHDFDPAEMPDGRIVFSSTRIGSREEYHGNSARSLFTMARDGGDIRPLTHHIVGDNEPVVTAEGLLAFIRCDNFLERAKVETQIHVVRPDGSAGQVLMGADRQALAYDRPTAAEGNASWLRNYGYGSPAPLPDGRVACLSTYGLVISAGGADPPTRVPVGMSLVDISPLPDGRLLCTVGGQGALGVVDLATGEVVRLYSRDTYDMHSAVYLGPRPRPPSPSSSLAGSLTENPGESGGAETGYLMCQSVFESKQTNADLSRVRAIRVYQGRPLTIRSARHSYDHIGVEAVELGTAPLAADGSFFLEVPADRALALQAVDGEGRTVVNELSWIYVRPGERRSCVGCHSPRQGAPDGSRSFLAMQAGPVRLVGRGRPHRFRGNNAANGGVLNLQLDRFREMAAIDLHSWEHANRAGERAALLGELRGRDVELRISAARRLGILRDRAAAGPLAAALGDEDADVRLAAALSLGSCGTRESVGALVKALDDASPAVGQAACVALGNLTAHAEAFDGYAPRSRRGGERWRQWAAACDWVAVEKALIAQLAAKDPVARRGAAVALGHVGGPAGRAALRDALKSDPRDDLRATLEVTRALGHLADTAAVGLLGERLRAGIEESKKRPKGFHELGWWQAAPYRAAVAAEALGRIGTPEAEAALVEAYGRLADFWSYTLHTGDHDWLMGCHASVVHFRIAEALDAMGSRAAGAIAAAMVKSVPIDTDRGLLLENDACEALTGRLLRAAGVGEQFIETCLAVLGDKDARAVEAWRTAVTASPPARSVGPLSPESRAAQVLGVVCVDARHAARIIAAFDRYRAGPPSRKRSWVCFFLARLVGRLGDRSACHSLLAAVSKDATEASFGRPDPPNVFLHEAMTPCYRAAAADALGRLGDRRAIPALLAAVRDLDNAMDVRHAAAGALVRLAGPADLPELRDVARDYPEVATRRELLRAVDAASRSRKGAEAE